MSGLTLYTNPMSRGRIARWMLEEVGQPYETVLLEYGGSIKAADYLAINPMGKVPALKHGNTIITETAAICAYLADAFPDTGLAPPPGSPDRGSWYRWLFFAAGPLEQAVIDRALGVAVPAEQEAMVGYGNFGSVLDALDQAVGAANADGRWLAGQSFTSADLYVGAHLSWGLQFKSIEERPSFQPFVERVTARPAYARADALDNADMAEAKQPS